METAARVLFVIVALIICDYVFKRPYTVIDDTRIVEYAKISTYPLGRMDGRTMISVYHLVYGIYALAYSHDLLESAIDIVTLWVSEQNDINDCLHLGCDMALKRITNIMEDPVKKITCNPEFDYHVIPMTLSHNDYVTCETLIEKIDKLIGGK